MFGFRNKNKPGITLGELLVVFIIMGVVASMMIVSSKPMEKSIRYSYIRTLNSLGTALYNSMVDPSDVPDLDDKTDLDGTFPNNPKALCNMLINYINTSAGKNNCNAAAVRIDGATTAAQMDSRLKTTEPHFVASNGVKYWIAAVSAATANKYAEATFGSNPSDDYNNEKFSVKYYVILADVNGNLPPNSTEYNKKKMADIVAFVLTEDADVVPIGIPVYDIRYLTARVVYATTAGSDTDTLNASQEMSYIEAQRRAWAISNVPGRIKISKDNPLSLNFYAYNQSTNNNGVTSGTGIPQGPFNVYIKTQSECNLDEYKAIPNLWDTLRTKHDDLCDLDPDKGNKGVDNTACYVKISNFN